MTARRRLRAGAGHDSVAVAAPVVACRDLRKTYRTGPLDVPVLLGVDLDVAVGERLAIVGASGSGKSTLLHLLGGLDLPTGGEVRVEGVPLATLSEARARRVAQPRARVHLSVSPSAARIHGARERRDAAADPARRRAQGARAGAAKCSGAWGSANRVRHLPGELSGGERQRVALARALVTAPRCVLADEPTGNLDRRNAGAVFDLMLELNRAVGTALIIVTHDAELAAKTDRTLHLVDGKLQSRLTGAAPVPVQGRRAFIACSTTRTPEVRPTRRR